MVITTLREGYTQKSRIFLYPALGIIRGSSTTPIETYVSWSGHYTPEDMKFICLYHLRTDDEFRKFEKIKLLGNSYFQDFKETDGDTGAYIFDFSQIKHDWECFLKGKYSKMSPEHKKRIKSYYGTKSPNYAYIESYLDPEKYFGMYSQLLEVDVGELKKVGELCSPYDPEHETLNINVKSLDLFPINS